MAQSGALLLLLLAFLALSEAYDFMDPNGDIIINWDFQPVQNDESQSVQVNIYNNQLYRHIEPPGWRLTWTWESDNVIWAMQGAEAMEQGNCSRFFRSNLPHSCEKRPVIVDLQTGTPYNRRAANCCKDGVLTSLVQDPSRTVASFYMSVGKNASEELMMPTDFSIGVPGYSCGDMKEIPATRFKVDDRRTIQALYTWQVVCSYSQIIPTCCVSLSTFYSPDIIPCTKCSCGCQSLSNGSCLRDEDKPDLQNDNADTITNPVVRCTEHMCPIRVHWHIKVNYKGYWRVKIAITNFNMHNYSNWNLVMKHPNFNNIVAVENFQYEPLISYSNINNTGVFWGIRSFDDTLLQDRNVQGELLLKKDSEFRFEKGWGLPEKISFNGQQCVMPPPDNYPKLPNWSDKIVIFPLFSFILQLICVFWFVSDF